MFDVLAHLELYASAADRAQALEAAAAAGVTDVVTANSSATFINALVGAELAGRSPRVHFAVGTHPQDAAPSTQPPALIGSVGKLVAVGECGLDHREGKPALDVQAAVFEAQVVLAARHRLPVIVHGVRSPRAILDVMRRHRPRWIWHAFSGSLEVAHEAVACGALLSIGAGLLDEHHKKTREVARDLALGVLVVESDAPDHAMSLLPDIVRVLAELRGESVDKVARATSENARALFGL